MKPIRLEMTAFGSYAEKAVVPFDRLVHGLYLIAGDTGAGKTTIFDAIMFALYGTASGPDRTPEMMHCDFVPKSTETEVILTFQQEGRTYQVQRKIRYRKKRGTINQYGDGSIGALLMEPDKAPIEGAKKVTDRCTELLGLNAEQFRKIIMLAQGEFKEFLDADSDKKNEILGRLFDNSLYVHYQELLRNVRDSLREERSAYVNQVEQTMQTVFQMPEGLENPERSLYLPEHPELVSNLGFLIGADERHLAELSKEREEYRRQENVLTEQKGAADRQNQLLDELGKCRERLTSLEIQAEAMARLQVDCRTVEKALHQVQPKQTLFLAADRALSDTKAEIEELENALERTQKELVDTAQAAVAGDVEAEQELSSLALIIQELEKMLPKYAELDGKRKKAEAENNKVRETEQQKADAEEQHHSEKEALEALTAELDALTGIDAQVVDLKNKLAQTQKNTAALTGETGIRTRVYKVMADQGDLAKQREELLELSEEAAAAERRHHSLYQAFINGQAGLIANELRQKLAVDGDAVCPVCGSQLHTGQEDAFAALPEETPTKAKVDAAKRDYEKKERKRGKLDKSAAALSSAIDREKESILRDARQLLSGCDSWDILAEETYLSQQIALFEQTEAEEKAALEKAVQKQRLSAEMAEQQKARKLRLEELDSTISRLAKILYELKLLAQNLDQEASVLKSQLQYPDEKTAAANIQERKERQNALSEQVKRNQKALKDATDAWNTIRGNLIGKRASLPKLEQNRTAAEMAFQDALKQNGFLDLKDMEQALSPLDGRDGEEWLKEQQDALQEYNGSLTTLRSQIKLLSEQTQGHSYTDLTELQERIQQTVSAYDTANALYGSQEKLLENHHAVMDAVSQAKEALADSEQAWNRLDLLANLAVGVSSDGGKLSFDRYVMGAVFREILEMANRRLNVMSGGKYELIHQISTDRKNAKAGLEVEVLDMITGKQRNSRSLSGGESFLVSLSLALGLSDVVQNHAGGKKLDAIFIDEGFGSLDSGTLDAALNVLNQLTEGNCLVGIISHVSKLEESIPQKIRVKNSTSGSLLQFE